MPKSQSLRSFVRSLLHWFYSTHDERRSGIDVNGAISAMARGCRPGISSGDSDFWLHTTVRQLGGKGRCDTGTETVANKHNLLVCGLDTGALNSCLHPIPDCARVNYQPLLTRGSRRVSKATVVDGNDVADVSFKWTRGWLTRRAERTFQCKCAHGGRQRELRPWRSGVSTAGGGGGVCYPRASRC